MQLRKAPAPTEPLPRAFSWASFPLLSCVPLAAARHHLGTISSALDRLEAGARSLYGGAPTAVAHRAGAFTLWW